MARSKKVRSKKLEVGKCMPPLYHKLPNKEYSVEKFRSASMDFETT